MSAASLAAYIGETWAVQEKGFAWFACIVDAKEVYGSLRFQVVPVAGIGTVWVNAERCRPLS